MPYRRLWPFLLAALILSPTVPTVLGQDGRPTVLVTEIDGQINRGTALYIEDSIEEAEERDVPLLITLETPGGLVPSMKSIDKLLAESEVPVLTYVPDGAWALSAGTFIFLMGSPNGMAENAQIGSAQPIKSSPSGGTENASPKVTNALVERVRSIANRTGHNETWAERFVTQNENMRGQEAKNKNISDFVSPNVQSFLEDVDGSTVLIDGEKVTLRTANAATIEYEKGLLVHLVEIVGNPQVAFVLFLIGLYGVIFGLAAPGTLVPETIGALALVLGLIGLGLFDASTSGLLLILLASAFFIAEVLTPTHGVLATVGAVALVLGAIFLLDEPLLSRGFLERFQVVALVSAVVSAGMAVGAVTLAMRTRNQPTRDAVEGRTAETLTPLDPEGQVAFHGERWQARSADGQTIPADREVRILSRDGLELTVDLPEETTPSHAGRSSGPRPDEDEPGEDGTQP